MQGLEVSGEVRPIYGSLGVKRLILPILGAQTYPESHSLSDIRQSTAEEHCDVALRLLPSPDCPSSSTAL